MEKQITIKSEYNSLDKINEFIKNESNYKSSIDYDQWDVRKDSNGMMEKCVVVKKSSMHGMKLFVDKDNVANLSYIIPNKLMHAYFGKSVKAHRNILEIITGKIKDVALAGSQKKAFEEMEQVFNPIKQ